MRAIVLLNPRSRAGARPPLERILASFRAAGWEAEVWAGHEPAWTVAAAGRAVSLGVDVLFGAGGDGMLASMLPALLGTETALGVVPLGTGNVWARELGLPLDPAAAIATQLARPGRRVDVGRANGRPFLVVASAGLDARIVQVVEAGLKGLGQAAYPLAGLGLVGEARGARCRATLDEAELEVPLLAAVVTNGRLYGGLVPLAPDARLDDGLLDVVLFEGADPLQFAAHVARVLAGQHRRDPAVRMHQVRTLRVESLGPPLPVQADGDPCGTTPLDVTLEPRALLALGLPPSL